MQNEKTYDIVYPGAIAGSVISDDVKTIDQLVAETGGTFEVTRTVRPTSMEYPYVPVARD